jgi:hypothetical protein
MRQKQLGVTSFVWQTMGDERVRDEHAERDGQEYEYDDPPDGELPGEPIMCRCWAEPVLDDLDDSDDEESDDDESTGTEPEPEQVLDPEESTSTLNLVDNPGLNPALESLLADDTAAQQAEAEASEGVGLGRIGVSSEIAGEEELGIAEGEAEQGVGLGRIGVSSEIAGEETAAAAAVEPAVAAPAAVIAPTTPTEKVLMPSTAAAPMGYASYTYDGETYYQHSVGGGAFLTGPQLVQYEAGNTVTLTGPNQQYQGFDALARKGMPTRYQFQEWIGQHKPMFSADDIKSGKANDDILWLIGHEHAKPTLVQRINRLLGGR